MTKDSLLKLVGDLPTSEGADYSFTVWMTRLRRWWGKVDRGFYDDRYRLPEKAATKAATDATVIYSRLPDVWGLEDVLRASDGGIKGRSGYGWFCKLIMSRGWAIPHGDKMRKEAGLYSRAKNELGYYLSALQKWWEFDATDAAEEWKITREGAAVRLKKLAAEGLVRRISTARWRRTAGSDLYLRTWGVIETRVVARQAEKRPKPEHCPLGSVAEIPSKMEPPPDSDVGETPTSEDWSPDDGELNSKPQWL